MPHHHETRVLPYTAQQMYDLVGDVANGCEVTFEVDFEFRNKLLQGAAGMFFNEAMQRVVRAFERRAADLYGTAD